VRLSRRRLRFLGYLLGAVVAGIVVGVAVKHPSTGLALIAIAVLLAVISGVLIWLGQDTE
jgi:hypothetical protein